MRFHRNLISKRPLPVGYLAGSTDNENSDQAIFQLGGKFVGFETDQEGVLERISVQARLKPIVYEPESPINAVINIQGKALESYELYTANKILERYGCLKAFEIHFERFLTKDISEEFKPESSILYNKQFAVQTEPTCILKQEILDGKNVVTPPGISGKQALWAYGGYYQPGCALNEVEQIVFTPVREHNKTGLHLSRISSWHTKDHDIVWLFPFDHRKNFSVLGDIEQGLAKFKWIQGRDEEGAECSVTYRSFAVYQRDRMSDLIEIDFYKEKTC